MKKKLTQKRQIRNSIIIGLRETIRIHGPITRLLIGSAAKRIAGALFAKEKIGTEVKKNIK